MKPSLLERHHLLTFVVLVGAGLGLTTVGVSAPERTRGLQRLGLAVTSPFARAGSGLATAARDAWSGLADLRTARRELAAARRENRDLRLVLADRRELAAENVRLRDLLDLADQLDVDVVPARIVHQQLAPDRVLVLDRGSRDGLREDLAVVAPGGVVGKILAVSRWAAKVQCLTDPDAGAAVLVGPERRQGHGVVTDASGGLLRMRHLGLLADVRAGDAVVTSGLDLVHPKGLPVGTVESVSRLGGGELEIAVRPAVDFDRLEEVLVLRAVGRPTAEAVTARRAGAAP